MSLGLIKAMNPLLILPIQVNEEYIIGFSGGDL
jgi:hypothetical protein